MKVCLDVEESEIISINVPEEYSNFVIKQYGRSGTWIMETDSVGLNHWKANIPRGNYEILGFTKDVLLGDYDAEKYKNFILRRLP